MSISEESGMVRVGDLVPVETSGEDQEGYILHEGYPVHDPEPPESFGIFVGFCLRPKDHPDSGRGKRNFTALGKTYARDFVEACCVILSHAEVQVKLAHFAIEFMVVRSTLDATTRVRVRVPAWAKEVRGR